MQLQFVNHASILVEAKGVRLISDPWLEGRIFDNCWDLLSPSSMSFDDFQDLTHIWFSHEHPDHFCPPNLTKIRAEHRARIHVLFQETLDKKVVRFCEDQRFGKVTELPPGEWVQLAEGFEVLNRPLGTEFDADSWLCSRTPDCTFLNINDCGVGAEEARSIKADVGTVDLLTTQFSYAAWSGNVEDVERRQERARAALRDIEAQIAVLKPRYVMPIASFVWFCAEDNFYLNAEMNQIRDVYEFIRTRTDAEPIVMYPGDRWRVGEPHDSIAAIEKYEHDLASVADPVARPRTEHELVPEEVLIGAGKKFRDRLIGDGSPFLVRVYLAYVCFKIRRESGTGAMPSFPKLARLHVEPLTLYVTDLDTSFTFDLRRGLRPCGTPRDECDIRLSSGSLAFYLRFPWGGETLLVNGCFQENDGWRDAPPRRYTDRLFLYSDLARRVNLGQELSWNRMIAAVKRKFAMSERHSLESS